MSVKLELLDGGRVAVRFPYDPAKVKRIKTLRHKRWVASGKYWEILLAEVPRLAEVLHLLERDIPEAIRAELAASLTGEPLEVRLDPLEGRILGSGFPIDAVDDATSFLVPGYKFSPRYKSGQWDGRRHLFSPRTQKFPAGLWPRVEAVLKTTGVTFKARRTRPPAAGELAFAAPRTPLRP
jgi:hypothetical protein